MESPEAVGGGAGAGAGLEHPLPEEITSMGRDDTVCKFCGVSYLIHHEIKKLENRISELEQELAARQNVGKENSALKTQLSNLSTQLSEKTDAFNQRNSECSSLKEDLSKLKKELNENASLLSSTQEEKSHLEDKLQKLANLELKCKESLPSLVAALKSSRKEVEALKSQLKFFESDHGKTLAIVAEQFENLKNVWSIENSTLLDELSQEKRIAAEKDMALKKKEESFDALNRECETLRSLEKAYNQLKEMYEKQQAEQSGESERLEKTVEELRMKSLEAAQYQQIIKSKDDEISTLQSQMSKSAQTLESSIQWYKDELNSKKSENRDLEERIATLQSEIRSQEERASSKESQMEQSITDYEKIKEAFVTAKAENDAMRQEREILIANHQKRIEDLQASYKEKMRNNFDFESKLNQAIEVERQKFEREKRNLEENLKREHKIELDIERQKFEEVSIKHAKAVASVKNEASNESKVEMRRLNDLIVSLQRELDVSRSTCDQQVESKQQEINLLTNRIVALEGKLESQSELREKDQAKLNERSAEVAGEVSQLRAERDSLQQKLDQAVDDIKSLQETVRHECEERFELTEALAQAREALLKNHIQTNPSSIQPPPQSQRRLPELETPLKLPEQAISAVELSNRASGLPPKPPSSTKSHQPNPPASREHSQRSNNSRGGRVSSQSKDSSPSDPTIAAFRAARNHRKSMANGSSSSDFKSMLNCAIRRGSTQ